MMSGCIPAGGSTGGKSQPVAGSGGFGGATRGCSTGFEGIVVDLRTTISGGLSGPGGL
jgi:hypothetical protein